MHCNFAVWNNPIGSNIIDSKDSLNFEGLSHDPDWPVWVESINDLLAQTAHRGAYSVNCYQARSRTLWDLCQHPSLLEPVKAVLGPNVVCWATHLFNKLPGDTKSVPWHQDAVFWHLAPQKTVTVWLAIDDADSDNSALQFIPGSHRLGALDWRENSNGDVLDKQVDNPESFGDPVDNVLKSGQFSVHHDLLLHGSQPNRSARRRCGLTLRYCTPDVRVTDQHWKQGIEAVLCCGEDSTGYWSFHPGPASDQIASDNGPRNIGGN